MHVMDLITKSTIPVIFSFKSIEELQGITAIMEILLAPEKQESLKQYIQFIDALSLDPRLRFLAHHIFGVMF